MSWPKSGFVLLASVMSLRFCNPAFAHSLSDPSPLPIYRASFLLKKVMVSSLGVHYTRSRFVFPASRTGGGAFDQSLTVLLTKDGLVNARQSLLLGFERTFAGPGSLATKTFNHLERTIVENGVNLGQESVPSALATGGTISGGNLQGDMYISIGGGQYANSGEFTGTIGTNIPANWPTSGGFFAGANSSTPRFQNTLIFTPPSVVLPPPRPEPGGAIIKANAFFQNAGSGSQRAFARLIAGLTARSVYLGQHSAISTVSGGFFTGTLYRNSTAGSPGYFSYPFNVPSASYIFAFGNSPLNAPNQIGAVILLPSQAPYVLFGNGVSKTITNGQILFPMFSASVWQNGSVMTMGTNPANNGIINNGPSSSLTSFLFF